MIALSDARENPPCRVRLTLARSAGLSTAVAVPSVLVESHTLCPMRATSELGGIASSGAIRTTAFRGLDSRRSGNTPAAIVISKAIQPSAGCTRHVQLSPGPMDDGRYALRRT